MSHWQMGVVPPAKCERSRAQWPGPGGANAVVIAPIMVSLAHPRSGRLVVALAQGPSGLSHVA
jgi:hypothetical protein